MRWTVRIDLKYTSKFEGSPIKNILQTMHRSPVKWKMSQKSALSRHFRRHESVPITMQSAFRMVDCMYRGDYWWVTRPWKITIIIIMEMIPWKIESINSFQMWEYIRSLFVYLFAEVFGSSHSTAISMWPWIDPMCLRFVVLFSAHISVLHIFSVIVCLSNRN